MIIMVLKGKAEFELKKQSYVLEKQDVIYLPMNQRLEINKHDNDHFEALIFEGEAGSYARSG